MQDMSAQYPLEQALVDFIHAFEAASLSERVRAACRTLIEDQIGLQVGCSQLPWSKQVLDFTLSESRPGTSRVTASAETLCAADAAFVNATYGHAFEYDDAHRQSASHPGSCVVATALAIGEEQGATLDEVLTALVVGYEVYTRIGSIAAPELLIRGFHPHAILSTYGAAAVAAKLRKFDKRTTWHALAIAASHASGITEYSSSGGSVKRVHSGIGVRNGIRSAQMADAGITGPLAYLSGAKGFYQSFIQKKVSETDASWFSAEAPMQIEKVWIKPYLCCGCCHAYIDAVRQLAHRADDIVGLELFIQRSANVVVGNKNAQAYVPETIEHVQYSLPVELAFTLLGFGNGYQVHRDCLEGKIDLSPGGKILRTAKLIKITESPELDRRYPAKFVAEVVGTFRDGSSERVFVEDSIGTAENPMSEPDLDAKFSELTLDILGENRARRLLAAIKQLDGQQRVASLTSLHEIKPDTPL